ncbi:MAG: DUF3164 family protein [Dysgonomonas sp.]
MNITTLTPEEKAALFAELRAEQEAQDKQKLADREAYKELVDKTTKDVFPTLRLFATLLGAAKKRIYDEFNSALTLKAGLYGVKEGQQSHMFTTSDGKLRIVLGYNVTDDYDDTVNEGIKKVHDYISSLARDEETQTLVNAVLRLLAKDGKTGTLKASRVLQLRKMAEDSRNAEFIDGVQIIEAAYRPAISKQYVKAQFKDDLNAWQNVHLGMTESVNIELDAVDQSSLIDSVYNDLLPFVYKSKKGDEE